MRFYIKDNYYFDIDTANQLRISGPQNHLFLGLTFPEDVSVHVEEYGLENGQLWILLSVDAAELTCTSPVVTDIRTLRNHTEQVYPRPSYAELLQRNIPELHPKIVRPVKRTGKQWHEFSNFFVDDVGIKRKYGTIIRAVGTSQMRVEGHTLYFEGGKPLQLKIRSVTNIRISDRIRTKIFNSSYLLPREFFSEQLLKIYDESQDFIEHLIKTQKTSSFEYGTIFPRDWIESADLGLGDLTQSTVDYMYRVSMQHISEEGEAWHEDVIGEFRTRTDTTQHVDRKMIDIEPRYILGMRRVSKTFLTQDWVQDKLRSVANYILQNAEKKALISFKQVENSEEYYIVGNWRDSANAYPSQRKPIFPYDVNCIFYPMSLRMIREFHLFFNVEDVAQLNKTIEKWDANKQKFRLYHSETMIGYSLALHGKRQVPLPVAHLDESYDLFYGTPSLEEVVSFAEKIMDPNIFYTPVGPLLVDIDEVGLSTRDYHGKVIWPKQAAYSVAGLAKQFRRGLKEGWPWPVIEQIKAAVIATAEACFTGWEQLGVVPELYYFDEQEKRARLYTDQEKYEGQMSLIQLWSSVGCRRIMQDYAAVKKIAEAI